MKKLTITPIPALQDNYIWLIHDDTHAVIIDAGESQPVVDYLSTHALSPVAFVITHHNAHATYDDHTGGLSKLKSIYPAMTVYGHDSHDALVDVKVDEGDNFTLLGVDFQVWRTAGHTDTHLSYLVNFDGKIHVFCGDTLFSGGCGRVFSGTVDELFDSLQRFNTLTDDVIFYPAHEYTLSNLAFGSYIAPQNTAIISAIAHAKNCYNQGVPTLPVSLAHERAVNVFLQVGDDHIKDRLIALGKITDKKADTRTVFKALRELKNNF